MPEIESAAPAEPTIAERIAELRPILAAAVAQDWPSLGFAAGDTAQNQQEYVASTVFGIAAADSICQALVTEFVDKVKLACQDKKVVVLRVPESEVHRAGKESIGAYVHVLIGFLA